MFCLLYTLFEKLGEYRLENKSLPFAAQKASSTTVRISGRSYLHDGRALKRIRVVSTLGCFCPGRFGLGRFGQFLGWVVSASVGGSFRPIFEVSYFSPGSFRPKTIERKK